MEFSRSPMTGSQGNDPAHLLQQAAIAHERGLLAEAELLYKKVLKKDRYHFETICRLGVLRVQQSRFLEAAELFRRAIQRDDKSADAHHYLAFALTGVDDFEEAKRHYEAALRLRADFFVAHNNFGHLLMRRGLFEEAILQFEKALALKPDYAEAHNNLGNVLHLLSLPEEAIAHYRKAITIKPDYAESYWNMANSLRTLGSFDEAITSYDQAIAIRPNYPEAYNSLANTFRILNKNEEAVVRYEKAIELKPGYVDAHINVAELLGWLGRQDDSLRHFDQALAINPNNAIALVKRGAMLMMGHRYKDAFDNFQSASLINSENRYALDGMARSSAAACDWARSEPLVAQLTSQVIQGGFADPPSFLAFSNDPAALLTCAETFATEETPPGREQLWNGQIWRNSKIRLGYLSAGFHQHPTAYLTAELIEIHDRSRFEVLGFSVGPDDGSEIRGRIVRAFDEFHDVRSKTDLDVAKQINEMEVDILIDRSGYTVNSRPGIVSYRPAPIQVNYIGFPGSLGANCYDYVIADRIVLPFDQQPFYTEKIVHLPDCYLVNDSRELGLPAAPNRLQAALPERGFVFCCFNNHLKITAPLFEIWMRLLRARDESVLWLLGDNPVAQENLRKEACARGLDPARLVFAPRVPLDQHLARHRLADLFLDTLPYNAHTTARDALLSGVPLITCLGETFAGRVAASVLEAAGLSELVTANLEEYQSLALRLASDPESLRALREKLAQNRRRCAFFDSDRYRRHIESCYATMWQLWQDGLNPRSFTVEAIEDHRDTALSVTVAFGRNQDD
jgi:protein O-GlcNAc transferase